MVCGHFKLLALPLLRPGRSYSLNEPKSVGIFVNAELLPTLLKYVISDDEVNLWKLFDSIRSLRAIQVFNACITLMPTSSRPFNVLLGHHPTYEDSVLVELVMSSSACHTVTDLSRPHRCLCLELRKRYNSFWPNYGWRPALRESIRNGIVASFYRV